MWPDILKSDIKGYNGLHWASIGGNYRVIQRMRDIQTDWKSYLTQKGNSSIELAAEMGNKTIFNTLLGDYIGTCDEENVKQTLLKILAKNGDIEMTRMIIKASNYPINLSHWYLLHNAVDANRPEYVKMLLTQYNFDPNLGFEGNELNTRGSALRSACSDNFERVVRVLLSHPQCDMTLKSYTQRNCLHWAVESGSLSLVTLIIETATLKNIKSALINEHDLFYRKNLHYVVNVKDKGKPVWHLIEVKRKLLKKFIENVNCENLNVAKYGKIITSGWGQSPNDQAQKKVEEFGKLCFDTEKDFTPLLIAMDKQHYEVAKLLVNYGCEINDQDYFGLSALHYAAMNGSKEMCAFLIINGVDINLKDNDGEIAKDLIEPTETYFLEYFEDLETGRFMIKKWCLAILRVHQESMLN